jgi:preprotein translocase subunit YajC
VIINQILLADAAPGGGMGSLLMIGLIFVVMYFFMIMPQMRKQKQQKKFREEIVVGDKIITIGGIHAKITKINEDGTMIIDSEGTKLKLERHSISMEATQALRKETAPVKE